MTVVRPARPGEARGLALVHIEAWRHAYSHIFSNEYLSGLDVEQRERWFEAQIARNAGLLVAEAGEPVGFCFFGDSNDEGWGEIFAIYVHPEYWGQGHGHRLLSSAEHELALMSHRRALLWVLDRNRQAREFYERQGWTLGKPIRFEEIGGTQVTEVRYETSLRQAPRPVGDPRDR